MTPEERLTKIERTLQSLTDAQVGHTAQIEKQNAGIRDLTVVGRTCLDSIHEMRQAHEKDYEEWTAKMNDLREAQAATDEKLNILIDTVDRILRHRNGNKEPS